MTGLGFEIRRAATLAAVFLGGVTAPATAQARHAITIDDFLSLKQASDLQLSPDGKLIAFTVSVPSLADNRNQGRIWLLELVNGEIRELTSGAGSDRSPRFSPDGRQLAFISTRSGSPQIWRMPARGGEATRITAVPTGVSSFSWSPDSSLLVVTDLTWPAQQQIDALNGKYPTQAKLWDRLFYRHWDEWRVGQRQHLFRIVLPDSVGTDLTPFDRDVPPLALGGDDIATSPFGTEIAIVFNPDSNVAASTNNDVFLVGPDGTGLQPVTTGKGNDFNPVYSPNGKYLAFLSMETPAFEADRQQVMLYDRATGAVQALTKDWNLSVSAIAWTPDARAIVAEVEERGEQVLYLLDVATAKRTRIVAGGVNTDAAVSPRGDMLYYLHQSATMPPEIYQIGIDGRNPKQLTFLNREALAQLDLQPVEKFAFVGALRDTVFGWTMKPPGFTPDRKYPLIYLVHGGPQSAWLDSWGARWNYAMFAAPGYVVAAVNFHGSTGYGQAFSNSISQHWGDYPYEDLMAGLETVAALPYVDRGKMCAAGASYGGYMIYWMAGHTTAFKCLVAHDGVFNLLSMAGSTEELWFPNWEFGGTPHSPAGRQTLEKWSPVNFVSKWATPMLVVHGQLDYRVDVSEGFQAFTALQERKIPSKFLYFPDEGHWVLKPRNRRVWWGTLLDWFEQYLPQ